MVATTAPDPIQDVDSPPDPSAVIVSHYYRWRQRLAPGQVDNDRRCRELELEVDRLKRLVAELLLDKTMLQDIAKKKW